LKQVFVTGGTGFLGKRLVRSLVRDGFRVRCLTRGTSDIDSLRRFVGEQYGSQLDIVTGELMDVQLIEQQLNGCEVIYHCAAGMQGAAATIFQQTVVPTRYLVQAALAAKTPRFVLVSSMGVYGAGVLAKNAVLDESCPIEPKPELRDNYTYSKVVQEEVVWEAHREHQLPVVVIRPGVIIGPGRGALSARVGLKVGPLQLRFGNRVMPYIFVENCADAIKQAGLVQGVVGQAINIVDDDLPTAKEVLKAYRSEQQRVRSLWLPQWSIRPLSRMYETYHRWSQGQLPKVLTAYRTDAFWKPLQFSNAKAKALLNWLPAVSMAEALRRSVVQRE
jgi:nucleoside-diphosphate-sugar epimerase